MTAQPSFSPGEKFPLKREEKERERHHLRHACVAMVALILSQTHKAKEKRGGKGDKAVVPLHPRTSAPNLNNKYV